MIIRKAQGAINGDVIPNKNLAYWEQIIEEWSLMIDRYCRIWEGDDPYWYTERANIGLLAGACWRAGFLSLEEFQWKKGYVNKPKYQGRADLWIGDYSRNILVEAKMKPLSLNSKTPAKTITPVLNAAYKAAKKSKGTQDMDALGMAFIKAYANKSEAGGIDDLIQKMAREMEKDFNDCLIFWHFPSETRSVAYDDGNIYPGLFSIARKV